MTPRHVFRVYGEKRIDLIAPIGSTGVGRSTSDFGSCYLHPGEFERLQAEGVPVVTMADMERLEQGERGRKTTTQMDFFSEKL